VGIFEDGDFYDQADLDSTFAMTAPWVPNGTHPELHGIDGGYAPYMGEVGVESLLDMSIIIPLVWPQTTILFQVDDEKELELTAGFGDTFLDALDAVCHSTLSYVVKYLLIKNSLTAHSMAVMTQLWIPSMSPY
jgi:tripeptidyl-peptidase-1